MKKETCNVLPPFFMFFVREFELLKMFFFIFSRVNIFVDESDSPVGKSMLRTLLLKKLFAIVYC